MTQGSDVVVDQGSVTLRTVEAGRGRPVVMLHGWSQSAALFADQVDALAGTHRVVAVDQRGHGRSDAPPVGYHVHRLAADAHDVLRALDLRDVTLLGHSMGCAVIWAYLELFDTDRVDSLVLVDQMACALRNPAWSDEQADAVGATLDPPSLFGFTNGLRAESDDDPRVGFLRDVTSDGMSPELFDHLVAENLRFDRHHAAGLIFDVASFDWRESIARIGLPTLVLSGDSVNVPIRSQRWIHEHIAGSQFARVAPASGGTHFPFLECPDEFNAVVGEFLGTRPGG